MFGLFAFFFLRLPLFLWLLFIRFAATVSCWLCKLKCIHFINSWRTYTATWCCYWMLGIKKSSTFFCALLVSNSAKSSWLMSEYWVSSTRVVGRSNRGKNQFTEIYKFHLIGKRMTINQCERVKPFFFHFLKWIYRCERMHEKKNLDQPIQLSMRIVEQIYERECILMSN